MNPRIASAGGSHQIPALPYLACADGSHGAVMIGTVAESVAHGNLFAVLRSAGRESRQATQVAEAGTGLAKAFYNKRVTESVVKASPVGKDRTSRLRVVHQDAVDHHVAVLRVVTAHSVAQRPEVVGRDAVEHVTRRVEQRRGIVDRGGGLLKVGIHQNHRR